MPRREARTSSRRGKNKGAHGGNMVSPMVHYADLVRRAAVLLALVRPPALARRRRPADRPGLRREGRLVQTPFAPPAQAAADEGARDRALPRAARRCATGSNATRGDRVTDATFDRTYRELDGEGLVGARPARSRRAASTTNGRRQSRRGPGRRWRGRWRAATRARSAARRSTAWPVWLALLRCFLIGPRRLAAAALAPQPRPARAALVLGLALVLQPRRVFTSVAARLPGARLPARRASLDRAPRPARRAASRPVWPVWVLAAAAVFLAGFRIGLNIRDSNVIDVGYAGVIGAQRIAHGEAPYGHFPVEDDLKPCGRQDADGEIRERIQTNGRCEAANPRGDTYGPVSYFAYLPGYCVLRLVREVGRPARGALHVDPWDVALHARARARRAAVRRQPARRDARVRVGRVPVHAVRLELEHERRDPAGVPDLGLLARDVAAGRAASSAALAGWTKFAALIVAPLWLTYPDAPRSRQPKLALRRRVRRSRRSRRSGCCCSSRTRCTRRASSGTARSSWQSAATRRSRSGTGGSTTRAACPTCTSCSRVLEALLVVGAVAAVLPAAAEVAAPARRADRLRS